MTDRILIKDAIVLTQDHALGELPGADILIEGDRSPRSATTCRGRRRRGHRRRRATSSSRASSTPTGTRGRRRSGRARRTTRSVAYFGAILDKFAPNYRPDDVYAANLWGALECINAGITTLVDWSHIMNTPDHADAAVKGLQDIGHPLGLRVRLPEHVDPGLVVRAGLRGQRRADRRRRGAPHPQAVL